MKTKHHFVRGALALALLATVNSQLSTARGQGSLTPPGPPGATMLTLSQIEPRTPISAAPFTISAPGSYYLTTNLTVSTGNAITIATNGVTLDLKGFTISSTENPAASGVGISLGAVTNISIYNGHISSGVTDNAGVYSGSGFGLGISSAWSPYNVRVSDVTVSGCQYDGISLNTGRSTVVESCTVGTVGSYGIIASTIKNCWAIDCGGEGIYGDLVLDCRGQCGSGDGIFATTAENCYGQSSSGHGLYATTALNCYGHCSSGDGLYATTAQNCYGYRESGSGNGDGIYAITAENCYGYSGGSGDGISTLGTASGCYGYSSSGTGLSAFIANVCHGATSVGTPLSVTHNVNSF